MLLAAQSKTLNLEGRGWPTLPDDVSADLSLGLEPNTQPLSFVA